MYRDGDPTEFIKHGNRGTYFEFRIEPKDSAKFDSPLSARFDTWLKRAVSMMGGDFLLSLDNDNRVLRRYSARHGDEKVAEIEWQELGDKLAIRLARLAQTGDSVDSDFLGQLISKLVGRLV